ncbi:MAG: hypothetical protein WBD36_14690 [Bacteroidota bacterium]
MGVVLDILGSILVRGMIIAIVIGLTLTLRDELYKRTSDANILQTLTTVGSVIEKDMTQAGYHVASDTAFLKADSTDCKFLGDIPDANGLVDGIVDTVEYAVSTDPSETDPSSKTRILARTVNGSTPYTFFKGPINVKFTYYDSLGVVTTHITSVASISILLSQWNTFLLSDTTAIVRRELWVFPSNL